MELFRAGGTINVRFRRLLLGACVLDSWVARSNSKKIKLSRRQGIRQLHAADMEFYSKNSRVELLHYQRTFDNDVSNIWKISQSDILDSI